MEGCVDVTHGHVVSGERLSSLSLTEKRPRVVRVAACNYLENGFEANEAKLY